MMLQREIEDIYAGCDENDLEEYRLRNNDPWVKFPVDLSMSNASLFDVESNAASEWTGCFSNVEQSKWSFNLNYKETRYTIRFVPEDSNFPCGFYVERESGDDQDCGYPDSINWGDGPFVTLEEARKYAIATFDEGDIPSPREITEEESRRKVESYNHILEKHSMLFQVDRAAREMVYRQQLAHGYASRFPETKQNAVAAPSAQNPSLPSLKLNLEGFLSKFSNENKLKA